MNSLPPLDWKNLLAHAAAAFVAAALLCLGGGGDLRQSAMAGAGAAAITIKAFVAVPTKPSAPPAPPADPHGANI